MYSTKHCNNLHYCGKVHKGICTQWFAPSLYTSRWHDPEQGSCLLVPAAAVSTRVNSPLALPAAVWHVVERRVHAVSVERDVALVAQDEATFVVLLAAALAHGAVQAAEAALQHHLVHLPAAAHRSPAAARPHRRASHRGTRDSVCAAPAAHRTRQRRFYVWIVEICTRGRLKMCYSKHECLKDIETFHNHRN